LLLLNITNHTQLFISRLMKCNLYHMSTEYVFHFTTYELKKTPCNNLARGTIYYITV